MFILVQNDTDIDTDVIVTTCYNQGHFTVNNDSVAMCRVCLFDLI